MISNYMETLVDNTMKTEFRDHADKYEGVCHCEGCRTIIKATALNCLKPFYVTSLAGEVYGEYQHKGTQQLSDVLVAVGKGVEMLRRMDPHTEK